MKTKKMSGLRALDRKLTKVRAKDIMTGDVVTTDKDRDLSEVARLIIKHRINGLPVVSRAGKIEGIVTENDLFMVMDMIKSGDIVPDKTKGGVTPRVSFAMSTVVTTAPITATLNEIFVLMKYRNQHTIPVVDKGRMVGVVGKRDVFKSFYAALKSLDR